jgi:hypothetical protein
MLNNDVALRVALRVAQRFEYVSLCESPISTSSSSRIAYQGGGSLVRTYLRSDQGVFPKSRAAFEKRGGQ